MGIGGALAEARSEAGLTVTQVSDRTRIRETIIRDIEHDDYTACGGDYYARGHIRAIARVVGTDPVPLIEEYDAEHLPPPELPSEDQFDQPSGWRMPGLHWLAGSGSNGNGVDGTTLDGNGVATAPAARNGHGRPGLAPVKRDPDVDENADTDPDLFDSGTLEFGQDASGGGGSSSSSSSSSSSGSRAVVRGALDSVARWAEAARARFARPPEPGGGVPGGITAAEAFRPSMPLQPRRSGRAWAVGLLVLVAIGLLIYFLVSGGSAPASAPAQHHATTRRSSGRPSSAHHSAAAAKASHGAAASHGTAPALVSLSPVSAAAFGPGGTAHGDDPARASLAIDGSARSGWHSDWYSTASLGGLQSGTGLLLNMGKSVSVTSARLLLGAAAGGTVQLRAGNAAALADLRVVAQATNPGGALTMHVGSPVKARYLLVWFTSLPPDNSGTYQADVYDIRVTGIA